ncbi:MAG: hypothetical protein JXQ29_02910 [Planctomycetes bacterium]|nr:hypothetical protein [Planctomycetota bacterium]
MVAADRVYGAVALVAVLVVGLLVFILRGAGSSAEPDLPPPAGPAVEALAVPADAAGAASAPEVLPPPSRPKPARAPAAVGQQPARASDNSRADPLPMAAASPVVLPAPPPREVLATLTDEAGIPLPGASVTVQTLSSPKRVLTSGPVRTDAEGRFRFEPPEASNFLHVWCPELQASARHPWRPEDADLPVIIRLAGRALVGRLVAHSGAAPNWPGINLKVVVAPALTSSGADPGPAAAGGLAVSLDRETGDFVALLPAVGDRDLTVSALGHTGTRLLCRVPLVNRQPPPVIVLVPDPRGEFGALSLRLEGEVADGPPAYLEAYMSRTAERLPLTATPGGEQRTGPLAAGRYELRAVAGDRLSGWQTAAVEAGQVHALGVLGLRERGTLCVRPLLADGSLSRSARARLESERGVPVRADFRADPQGLVARDVFPGRYRVVVADPAGGGGAWIGPIFIDVQEGGLHEAVFRRP